MRSERHRAASRSPWRTDREATGGSWPAGSRRPPAAPARAGNGGGRPRPGGAPRPARSRRRRPPRVSSARRWRRAAPHPPDGTHGGDPDDLASDGVERGQPLQHHVAERRGHLEAVQQVGAVGQAIEQRAEHLLDDERDAARLAPDLVGDPSRQVDTEHPSREFAHLGGVQRRERQRLRRACGSAGEASAIGSGPDSPVVRSTATSAG